MILSIGVDLVDMRVVDRNINTTRRIFTDEEVALAKSRPGQYVQTLGKRLAVKEAVMKALGIDNSLGSVSLKDIEVVLSNSGRPYVNLHGNAGIKLKEITPVGYIPIVDVSISDDGIMAVAMALIHARPSV